MTEHARIFIGGEYVESTATGTIDVISPHTEDVIGRVPDATAADIDRAVGAARAAFDDGPFPCWTPAERADGIRRLSQALQARAQEFAETISSENGCPIKDSLNTQVLSAVMVFEYFAGLTTSHPWIEDRVGGMGQPVRVRKAPVGVCGLIIPWNVPLYITAMKIAPALAAGCTAVLKVAPETPLDAYLFADAVRDAELPPGVINVVAAGREASESLVTHPGLDKISFTGSTATGKRVAALCGEQIRRCTLELGGKSAAIIMDDCDLETAVPGLLFAGLLNNGQACGAQTRILAPKARYAEVVDALGAGVGALAVGDPLDPATEIGPVVSERQRDKIAGYLASGKEQGARAVCGGGTPAALDRGWYIEPTVFADVDNGMRIAQEEIFGPVLSVIPYDGDDEAVRIANDSVYGLCGSVWTPDLERGASLAARVRTGVVAINNPIIADWQNPFGGFKQSGIGRECGPEGLAPYTEDQAIILPTPS